MSSLYSRTDHRDMLVFVAVDVDVFVSNQGSLVESSASLLRNSTFSTNLFSVKHIVNLRNIEHFLLEGNIDGFTKIKDLYFIDTIQSNSPLRVRSLNNDQFDQTLNCFVHDFKIDDPWPKSLSISLTALAMVRRIIILY